ncbi:hypothetical protein QQ020_02825 [Fulvivirgaceae bacterium BMA12]|uniref:Uncharacterized protein n=1 Tax=Agaribacillus aureus TaxID=3051825 RepID=A0ABT8KZU1_9BACT|nr:hypothetical protein [Fulvivirgaceae bacterium BMA12]
MSRARYFLIILGTIIVTALIIVLIRRPELLQDFWLWIVGFAGIIAAPIKNLYDIIREKLNGKLLGEAKNNSSEKVAALKNRVSTLESALKRKEDFYTPEVEKLDPRGYDLDDNMETLRKNFFEVEEDLAATLSEQPDKEEILTFIKSLTRKERRRLIRDGKLPGE